MRCVWGTMRRCGRVGVLPCPWLPAEGAAAGAAVLPVVSELGPAVSPFLAEHVVLEFADGAGECHVGWEWHGVSLVVGSPGLAGLSLGGES